MLIVLWEKFLSRIDDFVQDINIFKPNLQRKASNVLIKKPGMRCIFNFTEGQHSCSKQRSGECTTNNSSEAFYIVSDKQFNIHRIYYTQSEANLQFESIKVRFQN